MSSYVKFTLVKDFVKAKSHLVEDVPPLLKEMIQEPPSQRLQNIFFQ